MLDENDTVTISVPRAALEHVRTADAALHHALAVVARAEREVVADGLRTVAHTTRELAEAYAELAESVADEPLLFRILIRLPGHIDVGARHALSRANRLDTLHARAAERTDRSGGDAA